MALAGDPVQPLRVAFVNENTTYGSTDNAWILFSYTGSTATEFVGEVLGSGPNSGPITFSAGAVTFINPPDSVAEMIKKADSLMYLSKVGGKNTIRHEIRGEDHKSQK